MQIDDLKNCIETYGRDIYSFCCYLTRSRQEADDLYQDTFLKAMEILARLDEDGNPKSALLSVAANLWRNRRRKLAWRQRITGPVLSLEGLAEGGGGQPAQGTGPPGPDRQDRIAAPPANTGPDAADEWAGELPSERTPLDAVIARQDALAVRRAVSALPDKYRLPVLLFYMEEMKLPDIAALLRIPQGTVKSRLHKARKLLAQDLKEVLDET